MIQVNGVHLFQLKFTTIRVLCISVQIQYAGDKQGQEQKLVCRL